MQTNFTDIQRDDPQIQVMDENLRKCVHCGFCLTACPTYNLLGDERDSPRGRIYLIKEMLEDGGAISDEVVPHIDRCLSCLACKTACPSGVDYQRLIDHARVHIEEHYQRPWFERLVRRLIAGLIPHPGRFRLALRLAALARPFTGLLGERLSHLVAMAPKSVPAPSDMDRPQIFPAAGETKMRVALLTGCAQQVLRPSINEATIRLLTRLGCEVVVGVGAGCCGALVHHMGQESEARKSAQANIESWLKIADENGLDAVVANASGCGTMIKDYGFLFAEDAVWRDRAEKVAGLSRDVTEIVTALGLSAVSGEPLPTVAYHEACSLANGQGVTAEPRNLLKAAGFTVRDIPDGGQCCGSAGTYNLLQPTLANLLKDQKIAAIDLLQPEVIATGNIGCLTQLAGGTTLPVLHTVELLDWATGGPNPIG
ncbi:MAG: glycolate oxidase subunit GlcF [Proteobacteria bacterium]|nr:glycolate oxidase subunit GlcF [Pseudomonadota bacterium]